MKVCVIGADGKLGKYMIRHCLDRGDEVVGVCREEVVERVAEFGDRIAVVPGRTDDRDVIREGVAGCDGVLTVLVPFGVDQYATGTVKESSSPAGFRARLTVFYALHAAGHRTGPGLDAITEEVERGPGGSSFGGPDPGAAR